MIHVLQSDIIANVSLVLVMECNYSKFCQIAQSDISSIFLQFFLKKFSK